jgi:Fe-Mn family superoxide dismutase
MVSFIRSFCMKPIFSILVAIASFVCFADTLPAFSNQTLMQQVDKQTALFSLPPLPYTYAALEPFIDARTMDIHYNRHHQAYVNNLNKAIEGTKWQSFTLPELFAKASQLPLDIQHNAGGHWNHSFFWSIMSPSQSGSKMSQGFQKELEKYFGSIENFKERFRKAGLAEFGSGWTWLIRKKDGSLAIISTNNQDNPLMDFAKEPGTPLLTCDVWEHAYYLKYLNRRDEFLDAFWHVVNWQRVEELLKAPD